MYAIEITNLNMKFSDKQALNGLNMKVKEGSIYGFIGENGSGKSTTLKLLCGLMPKQDGEIKLFEKDYEDSEIRSQIGVLIEAPGCFPNYTVWNNMILAAYNLNLDNPKEKVKDILKLVRMEGSASNKYKNCSLGMKQRVGIAMALLGSPKLLILDEPINGLDADGVRIFREVILDITKKLNVTVVISSHLLSELEKIADNYGIIKNGKMVREMTKEELDKDCPRFIEISTSNDLEAYNLLTSKGYKIIKKEENIRIYNTLSYEEVLSILHSNDIYVKEITTKKISLEEYYDNLMGELKNEQLN